MISSIAFRRSEDGPPPCLEKCEWPTEASWGSAEATCGVLSSWSTGCAMECDDEIRGHLGEMQNQACSGDWPPPEDKEEEAQAEGEALDSVEHEDEGEEIPKCLMDCHFAFDFDNAESTCNALGGWTGSLCYDDCPQEVITHIHFMESEACSGNWPLDDEHARDEEVIEEKFEHPEEHRDEGTPECFNTCPGFPFEPESMMELGVDLENADHICEFIGENFGCTSPCPQEEQDFVKEMESAACSGNWPPAKPINEEDREVEAAMATKGDEEAHICVENCVMPCFHPTFSACWEPLWKDCIEPSMEACLATKKGTEEDCHSYGEEMCYGVVEEECKDITIDTCLPQCLADCGLPADIVEKVKEDPEY